ncbi:MAG: peptidoglycan-associated lipoprotein Pal [Roseitalea porphyridii]|uniref:peptidoglycan-associated lipoprotein Pal n=1 Tax=Roseitalea porphyridii TaxID=1852022 RepID=UPI0032EBD434
MRVLSIGPKILTLFAVLGLAAACETAPEASGEMVKEAVVVESGVVPGSEEDLVLNVGDRVYFAFDSYAIRPTGTQVLDRQAAWMAQYPQNNLVIEGHCDDRGTREYNLALGERRANAVRQYLVSKGVAPSRLTTISYGKERPVAFGNNEAAWAQNRRGVSVLSN